MSKGNKLKLWEHKLAFIDIETTGLYEDVHEIIEIGVLIYDQVSDTIEREWEVKIAPSHIETAEPIALKINGYYNDPESYKGNLKSALIKFNSLVRDCLIVGQNVAAFDMKFIYKGFGKYDIKPSFGRRCIDLTGVAWFAVKNSDIPGLSLESFCDHFGVLNDGAHTALIDCRRTFEVYRRVEGLLYEFFKSQT